MEVTGDDQMARVDYIEATKHVERRMKNIFIGSMALSALIFLTYGYLSRGGVTTARIVHVSFLPLLLWSFTITIYSFYSLSRLSKERVRILEDVAVIDYKTGVKSRDFIKLLLQKEYERTIQTRQPTAVLYVDLEKLDLVNENYGHAIGDIVLKDVAGRIESGLPEGATVGHVGGDEFVVVLPLTNLKKAKSVAAGIEQSVRQYRLDLGKRGRVDFLGCSVGVIACPKDAGFSDEIIAIARKAAGESDAGLRDRSASDRLSTDGGSV